MVYVRLEGKTGNRREDGREDGRDRDGADPVEYWDSRSLDTCDIGSGIIAGRAGGDVIRGGSAGWFGFDDGEDDDIAGVDVADDGLADITVVIFVAHTGRMLRTTLRPQEPQQTRPASRSGIDRREGQGGVCPTGIYIAILC
jgi:hypothetical protein